MRLHENNTLFKQAVQFTADQMKMPAIYVEKDYWVTYALYTIFNSKLKEDVVFKGGTALSKCYNLIDRFSEDIDLVVLRRDGEADAKMKSKLKAIGSSIVSVLPEVAIEGITRKMGMNRKTAHEYQKEFSGSYGQVRDVLILESTWLGYYEPYTTRSIVSFTGQMMLNNGQQEIAEEYGLLPFEVLVLEPIRTICEKIMSLVRFSYSENPLEDLKKKIRHTYDLHKILLEDEYFNFLNSPEFEEMLLKVANDDVVSFRNNNEWLQYHPKESLFFRDLDDIWSNLDAVLNREFSAMVYGSMPESNDILSTLMKIRVRLDSVGWNVKI